MVDLKIGLLKETETIQYAAQELVKYLGKIDPSISCQIVTGEADVSLESYRSFLCGMMMLRTA